MAENRSITEAEAIAALSTGPQGQIIMIEEEGGLRFPMLLARQGTQLTAIKDQLAKYAIAPDRREGVAKFEDLASFIGHVNRFKDESSALFASSGPVAAAGTVRGAPTLTAVLDYHHPTAGDRGPRFGRHRSHYSFPLSDEWTAWLAKEGEAMTSSDFAAFLEERIVDVALPGDKLDPIAARLGMTFAGPQRLLDVARGLTIRVNSVVRNAQVLASGEVQLQYTTEHQDGEGKPLNVPTGFLICIPVFRRDTPYEIAVRLRYRTSGGTISWFYDLHRAQASLDDALKLACDRAQKETALPLFFGSPE